jgi:pyruvate,orthophosphate dikinase
MREMILADDTGARKRALAKLLPLQRRDFEGIFMAMGRRPVTIRTLDPPLHEFLPHEKPAQRELAKKLGLKPSDIAAKVESLTELNPMLGHRGCRLGITFPEITQMQVRAVFEAACNVAKRTGKKPRVELMIPLIASSQELEVQEPLVRATVEEVFAKKGIRVPFLVGTMIELPRAALVADAIARTAEFFSFGTNDLTQTTFGISRDDAGKFIPEYIQEGIYAGDPFASLDTRGVGRLMEMAVEQGRATRPEIKLGICGEHGGDPRSIDFCEALGLAYVSCSPYRIPIARLAAAQAALRA